MFFEIRCCVCNRSYLSCEEIHSYYLNTVSCMITKAICKECNERTKEKWLENGWQERITTMRSFDDITL